MFPYIPKSFIFRKKEISENNSSNDMTDDYQELEQNKKGNWNMTKDICEEQNNNKYSSMNKDITESGEMNTEENRNDILSDSLVICEDDSKHIDDDVGENDDSIDGYNMSCLRNLTNDGDNIQDEKSLTEIKSDITTGMQDLQADTKSYFRPTIASDMDTISEDTKDIKHNIVKVIKMENDDIEIEDIQENIRDDKNGEDNSFRLSPTPDSKSLLRKVLLGNTSVQGSCSSFTSIEEPQSVDSSANDSDTIRSTSNDMLEEVDTFPSSQQIKDTFQRSGSTLNVVSESAFPVSNFNVSNSPCVLQKIFTRSILLSKVRVASNAPPVIQEIPSSVEENTSYSSVTNNTSIASVSTSSLRTSFPSTSRIVKSLMRYRQRKSFEGFEKQAVYNLVRKLKKTEVTSLIAALSAKGESPTKCVTVPRTFSGLRELQGVKSFPHVLYYFIWRSPSIDELKLKHIKGCQFGFDLKRKYICINPYHYEQVLLPKVWNKIDNEENINGIFKCDIIKKMKTENDDSEMQDIQEDIFYPTPVCNTENILSEGSVSSFANNEESEDVRYNIAIDKYFSCNEMIVENEVDVNNLFSQNVYVDTPKEKYVASCEDQDTTNDDVPEITQISSMQEVVEDNSIEDQIEESTSAMSIKKSCIIGTDGNMTELENNAKLKVGLPSLFSEKQINILEQAFEENEKQPTEDIKDLSISLEVPEKCIYNWFNYRQYKKYKTHGSSNINCKKACEQKLLTKRHRFILRAVYNKAKYLTEEQSEKLADSLGISTYTLKRWFYHKRKKDGLVSPDSTSVQESFTSIEEPQYIDNSADDSDKISTEEPQYIDSSADDSGKIYTEEPQYIDSSADDSDKIYTAEPQYIDSSADDSDKIYTEELDKKFSSSQQINDTSQINESFSTAVSGSYTEEESPVLDSELQLNVHYTEDFEENNLIRPTDSDEENEILHFTAGRSSPVCVFSDTMDMCFECIEMSAIFQEPRKCVKVTQFCDGQLDALQNAYERKKYPTSNDYEILSQALNLTRDSIMSWFRHSRRMEKVKDIEVEGAPPCNTQVMKVEGSASSFANNEDSEAVHCNTVNEYSVSCNEMIMDEEMYVNNMYTDTLQEKHNAYCDDKNTSDDVLVSVPPADTSLQIPVPSANIEEIIYISSDDDYGEEMNTANIVPENVDKDFSSLQQIKDTFQKPESTSIVSVRQGLKPKKLKRFTKEEKSVLEEVYKKTKYLNNELKEELGKTLQTSRHRLRNWFDHRRRKDKIVLPHNTSLKRPCFKLIEEPICIDSSTDDSDTEKPSSSTDMQEDLYKTVSSSQQIKDIFQRMGNTSDVSGSVLQVPLFLFANNKNSEVSHFNIMIESSDFGNDITMEPNVDVNILLRKHTVSSQDQNTSDDISDSCKRSSNSKNIALQSKKLCMQKNLRKTPEEVVCKCCKKRFANIETLGWHKCDSYSKENTGGEVFSEAIGVENIQTDDTEKSPMIDDFVSDGNNLCLSEDKNMKTNGGTPEAVFTDDQLCILEQKFKDNKRPTLNIVLDIAEVLDVSADDVMSWFKKRRGKEKIYASKQIKRKPYRLSEYQKSVIRNIYMKTRYINDEQREKLTKMLGIPKSTLLKLFARSSSVEHSEKITEAIVYSNTRIRSKEVPLTHHSQEYIVPGTAGSLLHKSKTLVSVDSISSSNERIVPDTANILHLSKTAVSSVTPESKPSILTLESVTSTATMATTSGSTQCKQNARKSVLSEEEKYRVYRERNNIASKMYRKKKADLEDTMLVEAEKLEKNKMALLQEIQKLELQKRKWQLVLKNFAETCHIENTGGEVLSEVIGVENILTDDTDNSLMIDEFESDGNNSCLSDANQRDSLNIAQGTTKKYFTAQDELILEEIFKTNHQPNIEELRQLVLHLKVDFTQVCEWFKRKRIEEIQGISVEQTTGILPKSKECMKYDFLNRKKSLYLERVFQKSPYSHKNSLSIAAKKLGVPKNIIYWWFRNKRKINKRKQDENIPRPSSANTHLKFKQPFQL